MPITADHILTAVFKRLNADATLQGASYLTGSGRIEKGPRRRKGLTAPCVTLKLAGLGIDTESKVEDALVYINCYAADKPNGTADVARLALVGSQIETLLDDYPLAPGTGYRFFNCYVTSPHGEAFMDPDFPDEHYMTSTVRIQCQAV